MEKRKTRDLGETLRDEMVLRDDIGALLQEGALSIPEISDRLGYPSSEITQVLMAMRRYGFVEELPKSRTEDYYQYQLKRNG